MSWPATGWTVLRRAGFSAFRRDLLRVKQAQQDKCPCRGRALAATMVKSRRPKESAKQSRKNRRPAFPAPANPLTRSLGHAARACGAAAIRYRDGPKGRL